MVTASKRSASTANGSQPAASGPPRWPFELRVWAAAFVAAAVPGLAVFLWQAVVGSPPSSTSPGGTAAGGIPVLIVVIVLAALLAFGVLRIVLAPLQWLTSHPPQDPELPRRGIIAVLAAQLAARDEGQPEMPPPATVPVETAAMPPPPPPVATPVAMAVREVPAPEHVLGRDVRAAVHGLTARISQTAEDATRQAAAGSRTIHQMETMAVSASGVSERTTEAAAVAGEAVVAVGTGQEALLHAQAAMALIRETTVRAARQVKVLGESAQFVRQAVGQVQYSADELHLIAGNASIEAARHPQAAGFFRNVADSIEQLAQQSQVALGEIQQAIEANRQETGRVAGVIEDVVAEVGRGSAAVTSAGHALDTIKDVVEHLAGLNQTIAEVSREQVRLAATVAEGVDLLAGTASATSRGATEQAELAVYVRGLLQKSETGLAAAGGGDQ